MSNHKELDAAKYTAELARLLDVLVVRYNGEHKHDPSTYVRVKLRTQVINFLAERFPAETEVYRRYLLWMKDAISGTFRSIPNDEVPEEYQVGHQIHNSSRGKLSAYSRYRNAGIAAFRGDRTASEDKKYQARQELLNGAAEDMEVYERTLPMLVQASEGAVRNALDVNIAIHRYRLAVQHCAEKEALLASDEVVGLLMGMSPDQVAAHRESYADRYVFEQSHHGGWWIQPVPEKTLMEKIMDKLGTMDRESLESLADLLKDSD